MLGVARRQVSSQPLSLLHAMPGLGMRGALAVLLVGLSVGSALAVPMTQDPKGFHDIPWGAQLADRENLVLTDPGERIQVYDFKNGPPTLGGAKIDSVKLSSIEGRFARVTIRYAGKQIHEQVLAHLESQYGPIDRSPGSMIRGLNQQYTWRGPDTEINLVYQAHNERGVIFIESRVLAPRFNDTLSETAY